MDIIEIIHKHSLTVRCLPYETITCYSFREGDEKFVERVQSKENVKREIFTENLDLEYFKNTKQPFGGTDSPERRLENWRKGFPNGRKLIKETKTVKNGGWWYVKETQNTDSTIRFSREYDKFFAPTLKEAIQLYLDSL